MESVGKNMDIETDGAGFNASESTEDLLAKLAAGVANYRITTDTEMASRAQAPIKEEQNIPSASEVMPQAEVETGRFAWSGRILEGQTDLDVSGAQKNFDSAMRYLKSQENPSNEMIAEATSMVITTMKIEDITRTHSANDLEIRTSGTMVDNVPSTYSKNIMPSQVEIYAISSRHDGAPLVYCLGERNAKEFKQLLITAMSGNENLAA